MMNSKAENLKMNQELLLADLPSEIIIKILLMLPVRTITCCKCVSKSWLDLVNSPEFVKFHLSESKPGLLMSLREDSSTLFQITEFQDSIDFESGELHYNPIIKWDFGAFIDAPDGSVDVPDTKVRIRCSVNGLLFVMVLSNRPHPYYICNPVTREYIQLPNPIPTENVYAFSSVVAYGFGVTKTSDQYMLVRLFRCIRDGDKILKFVSQVYTLGTGSWRTIEPDATLKYDYYDSGTFLDGNIHWLAEDLDLEDSHWISCFDLETELFSTFLPPPNLDHERFCGKLVAFGDCLCFCDNTPDYEIVIWLMKEYGVEKSWTKSFVISRITDFVTEFDTIEYPFKACEFGGVVMVSSHGFFYYSNEPKTATDISLFGQLRNPQSLCTPSFLSIRSTFPMENTNSF